MSIAGKMAAAGVVDGAGFPVHARLRGTLDHLVISSAEREPHLHTNRFLLLHRADEVVRAARALMRELRADRCTVLLTEEQQEERAALEQAVARSGAAIDIDQPSEESGLILDIPTVLAMYDALNGTPMTRIYVTVTGAVHRPSVLRVPVGVSFARLIELAGGAVQEGCTVVSDGRQMSMEQAQQEAVTKTVSGILVLPPETPRTVQEPAALRRMLNRARSLCIQCGACTRLCPAGVQPHRIMRRLAMIQPDDLLDDPVIQTAQQCIECGMCTKRACPMELQPGMVIGMLKNELAAPEDPRTDCADCEWLEEKAGHVRIPLDMHTGVPAIPIVLAGDRVKEGQLIASCPNGALGCPVHASIGGRVISVTDHIEISSAL